MSALYSAPTHDTAHTVSLTCHTFGSGHVFQLLVALTNQKPRKRSGGGTWQRRECDVSDTPAMATPFTTKYVTAAVTNIPSLVFVESRNNGRQISGEGAHGQPITHLPFTASRRTIKLLTAVATALRM